jgi:hypothetical protein
LCANIQPIPILARSTQPGYIQAYLKGETQATESEASRSRIIPDVPAFSQGEI